MPTFEDVVQRDETLIRKPLNGAVFLGYWPTAPNITTLVAADGLTLPVSYPCIGWISEDGLAFGMDEEASEVRGWGSGTFLRRDIQSRDLTVQFAALEDNKRTRELYSGLDLSAVKMSAEGEVTYVHPDRPPTKYWSVLCLGVDGDGDSRYYIGKYYKKASVTDRDEEAWSDGDDPLMRNVTMGAVLDSTVGYSCREFLFGPGALAAAERMGWEVEDE